jgi:hypothetical protein
VKFREEFGGWSDLGLVRPASAWPPMLSLTSHCGLWAWKLKGNDATRASDVPAAEFVIGLGALDGSDDDAKLGALLHELGP